MKLYRTVLVVVAMTTVAGCVTMAGNGLRDLERATPREVPRVEQTIGDFSFHLDGGKMITSIKAGRLLNDEILGRWKKWGYISSQTYVKSGSFTGAADYELTLGGNQDGDSSIMLQLISGLSLMVIPYYVDTRYNVIYDLRNRHTGATYRAAVSDSHNTIISLLMIPASPFAQGGRTKTWDRIAENLYAQLQTQGAFSSGQP
ncbi:MAG: hypothetical protein ABR587_05710 [Candidatus Binatia bacterium]